MANTIKLIHQKPISKHLAMESTVQQALRATAMKIMQRAEMILAVHRKTGSHKIEYERIKNEKYGHIDHYVVMTGPAPLSVEFGHISNRSGKWVQGLYIITRASFGGL